MYIYIYIYVYIYIYIHIPGATSRIILSSRIMKFVAQVSSSSRSEVQPASSASMIEAAWETKK